MPPTTPPLLPDVADRMRTASRRCVEVRHHAERLLEIDIPSGDGVEKIWCCGHGGIGEAAKKEQFENWQFVPGFEAVWSPSEKCVECQLASREFGGGHHDISQLADLARRLGTEVPFTSLRDESISVEVPCPAGVDSIRIRFASQVARLLLLLRGLGDGAIVNMPRLPSSLSVQICSPEITSAARAAAALEGVAQSALFSIDEITGILLYPCRTSRIWTERSASRPSDEPVRLSAPKFQYDSKPLGLYWYARSVARLPLLQFLAYYQVLEYYFPSFIMEELKGTAKGILKTPSFDPDDDSSLTELLANVQQARFGDEREQLKMLIRHCVEPDQLADFITADKFRAEFLRKEAKSKVLSDHSINLDSEADARDSLARRIYAIRCRIVHAKSEGDWPEPLLPFSKASRSLVHDIECCRFLAKKVLIARSRIRKWF